jgi:RimJ/RimL family protein N-acetyltransferase
MRAAIVELLWALGAQAVTSGAVEGNIPSARISEKLGYRAIGTSEIAPRGVVVTNTLFRLEPQHWKPSVTVEIEGLEPVLPLFGTAQTGSLAERS